MHLTTEQLDEITTLAGLFLDVADILINLQIPVERHSEFTDIIQYDPGDPIYMAYHSGRITAQIELRTSIKKAAANGSNPAQITMTEFFNKSQL